MLVKCENCGKEMNKYPYEIKILKHIFCGYKCRVESRCKKKKNWNFFSKIDTEEKAYWLGFICADGWLCNSSSSIGIELSVVDKNHLLKFADIFDVNIRHITSNNRNNVRVQLCNKLMFLDLNSKGMHTKKSMKNIVKIFDYIPDSLMNHFIRGWFDGDGCINIRKDTTIGMFSIVGEKKNLEKIQNNIITNIPSLKKTKISKYRNANAYRLRWGGTNQIIEIRKWLYQNANIFMDRKKLKFDEVSIKEIKGSSVYRGVYWDKTRNKWIAAIGHNKKMHYLGGFNSEKEASRKYDKALIKFERSLNYRNNA